MDSATQWTRTRIANPIQPTKRATHYLWQREVDGKVIFTVLSKDTQPGPNDGGYYSVEAALKIKGLL